MSTILVIGEKLNSAGKTARRILQERDESALIELATRQTEAGAEYLDLNASMLMTAEPEALAWAAEQILDQLDVGICFDSPDTDVLLGMVSRFGFRTMLNSLTCEKGVLDRALPVIGQTEAGVIIMLKSGTGVPATADERLRLAETAAAAVLRAGIDPRRIFFDPILMPAAISREGLRVTLDTLYKLVENFAEFQRIGGLSNISFGLPMRRLLNRSFLSMAVAAGLTAIICDPTDERLMETLRSAEALLGLDPGCKRFLSHVRSKKHSS